MAGETTRLAAISALLLAGVLAGAQLGKIAPLVGWYQGEVGFSLVLIGWFTAMIGMFVALAALPAGLAIERFGMRRAFMAASAVLVGGGLALAFLGSPAAILAARLVEGAAYLVLVIAIPALLNSLSLPAWRAPVLAIWGGFVPVGFAAADFLAAGIDAPSNPRIYLVIAIVAYAAFALLASALIAAVSDSAGLSPAAAAQGLFRVTLTPAVLLVSLAFGIYVILSVGFFSFMPAFVARQQSGIAVSAGVVALISPVGNILASLLVGSRAPRFSVVLAMFGFALIVIAALPAFSGGQSYAATASALVIAIACGVTASALFAVIPFIVPRGGSTAIAIGLVCQAGGIGTVFGPPLAARIIGSLGWSGFGWFLAITSVIGILSLVPLLARRLVGGPAA